MGIGFVKIAISLKGRVEVWNVDSAGTDSEGDSEGTDPCGGENFGGI